MSQWGNNNELYPSFGTVVLCSFFFEVFSKVYMDFKNTGRTSDRNTENRTFFNFRISEKSGVSSNHCKRAQILKHNKQTKEKYCHKILMAICSFCREIVLSVCLRIRRDTGKCMFSSFPLFKITKGAFSGLLRFIALCRDWQYSQSMMLPSK